MLKSLIVICSIFSIIGLAPTTDARVVLTDDPLWNAEADWIWRGRVWNGKPWSPIITYVPERLDYPGIRDYTRTVILVVDPDQSPSAQHRRNEIRYGDSLGYPYGVQPIYKLFKLQE